MDLINLQTLAIISVLTGLCTECVKQFCRMTDKGYISNIIAAVIAVGLSFFIIVIKPICVDYVAPNPQMFFDAVVMSFFSVLSATLGFDKVMQTITKLKA